METAWNSYALEVAYTVLGWTAFVVWSCSFYPQVFLNFFRKSVVGLNFNYLLLNNTKHTLYLIYNTSLYFSPAVRFQYQQKYGFEQMIPVAANDVAFSTHAVLLSAVLLFQVAIYERGNQSFSKITIGFITAVWITVAVCSFIAFPTKSWLWLISIFNTMQVIMAVIKYVPQAVMNFMRRSTDGFSIGNVLLDFWGGLSNYAQMVTQSIDQNSWVNLSGNIGKVLLSLMMIPVAANDVAFSAHAVLLTAITLFQIAIYERGSQKVSKIAFGIIIAVWLSGAICFFIALPQHRWLWLVSIFNVIQVCLTIIKYIPQLVGSKNFNFLSMEEVSVVFDVIFLCQHYLLYPAKNNISETSNEPNNVKSSDQPLAENV